MQLIPIGNAWSAVHGDIKTKFTVVWDSFIHVLVILQYVCMTCETSLSLTTEYPRFVGKLFLRIRHALNVNVKFNKEQ